MKTIICVAGARPNFMKIAPLMRAFAACPELHAVLVHTGQHYDHRMSAQFFDELDIPVPDVDLGVGSGSHAVQTAAIMRAFEPVVVERRPAAVLVVGDVNSTLACALVAVKLGVKVAHVEAGLRSFDRAMPEEINRLVTDAVSDFLFCTEESGVANLRREGVPEDKVFLAGNVMIDTLLKHRDKARGSAILKQMGLQPGAYAALTLHRPSNVDDAGVLGKILDAIEVIQRDMPVVFPAHPRTRKIFEGGGFGRRVLPGLHIVEPLGYLDFLQLMASARLVLTDSGGVQEETTILGVPCLTLRENTERPITVTAGTNRLAGTSTEGILACYREAMRRPPSPPSPLWDGKAAERIAAILAGRL